MNLIEAATHIGISDHFLNYLLKRNLIHFVDKDDISMVECAKYKTEFALSKLQLLDRFASMDNERKKLIDDVVIDELDKL